MITKNLHVFLLFLMTGLLLACNKQPDFQYSDATAGQYEDFSGQWLVINYWAVWCKPCIEEIPELNKLAQQHKNIQVVGINFDSATADQLSRQAQQLNIQFPIAMASPHKYYAYDYPKVLPSTVIINPKAELKQILIGPQTQASILKVINQ